MMTRRSQAVTPRAAALLLALAGALLTAGVLTAQPQPPAQAPASEPDPQPQADPPPRPEPEPAPPTLTARDLLVLKVDRYGEYANGVRDVQTTLFNGVTSRDRALSEKPGPMPLGLITFEGAIDQPMLVQLDVMPDDALVYAHWPQEVKGDRLITWYNTHASRPGSRAVTLPEGYWLAPLRDAENRLWLSMRNTKLQERFMLYDVSLPYASPVEVTGSEAGEGAYDVVCNNATRTPVLTMLVRGDASGWSAREVKFNPATGDLAARGVRPEMSINHDLRVALEPLTRLLTERGYNATEVRLAMDMVRSAGLDSSRLALVYVMPRERIDELIPLRFRPEPDQIIRTAIVVVTNVDPDLGSRVEALLAELGSDDWPTRDRAQKQLTAMGQAAIRQVQAQRNHPDPETAFRVRQVLDAYDLRFGTPDR